MERMYGDLYDEAIRQADIGTLRQRELARSDILTVLSTSDDFEYEECAEEKEAYMKLETMIDSKIKDTDLNIKLTGLATDWYAAGRNAGFKAGFRVATKLIVEGMS